MANKHMKKLVVDIVAGRDNVLMEEKEVKDSQKRIKDKQRVEKFFKKLEASSIFNHLNFNTVQEKRQALIRFARMIGVPPNQLSTIFQKMKKQLNTKD